MSALTRHVRIFSTCQTFVVCQRPLYVSSQLSNRQRDEQKTGKSVHLKYIRDPDVDREFRVLVIPGHTKYGSQKDFEKRKVFASYTPPPRSTTMKPDQDWTNVWPTAETFKWSAIPFPVRQGFVQKMVDNGGIPPSRYANAELMKIPNFLHLTPKHIKKHCAALKKFCTAWPEGLETKDAVDKNFPLTVTTCDYVFDSPSIRDKRAITVSLELKLSSLPLDHHAKDKLKRLVGARYNPKKDLLTLVSDRCPTRKQNEDYVKYLLTAVFYEAWKTEPWESTKERADMENYTWHMTPSKPKVVKTLEQMKKVSDDIYLKDIDDLSEEAVEDIPEVAEFRGSLEELHDEGECVETLNKYKEGARGLLGLPVFR